MPTKINSIIVIDIESGGLSPIKNPITQIAYEAFQLDDYEMLGENSMYVKPYNNLILKTKALEVTGITPQKLEKEGVDIKTALKKLCEDFQTFNTSGSAKKKPILVGHNIGFDIGFIMYAFNYCKMDISKYLDCNEDMYGNPVPKYIDTLGLAKSSWGASKEEIKYNLTACTKKAGLEQFEAHSALSDVRATTGLFLYFIEMLRENPDIDPNVMKSTVTRENTVRKHFQF